MEESKNCKKRMTPEKELILLMSRLEKRLTCRMCKNIVVDPHYRSCFHFFCKSCLLNVKDACPVCTVPYLKTHIQSHSQIAALIKKFAELKELLSEVEFESYKVDGTTDRFNSSDGDPGAKAATPSSRRTEDASRTSTLENSFSSPATASSRINKRNRKGETRLQVAAIKGLQDEVLQLLLLGADVNTKDNAGWTPLHEASHHGHLAIVETLLSGGANVNLPGNGNLTPLQDAVQQNRLDVVRILMSYGANPLTRTLEGQTAFDLAQTDEMKEILCKEVPQDLNRIKINATDENRLVILGTGLDASLLEELAGFQKLLNSRVVNYFSDQVTHLVTKSSDGSCPRTFKYLMSVLRGKWIVTTQWVAKCVQETRKVPEDEYEVTGTTQNRDCFGPSKGRKNASVMQNPGLFSGCQFYFYGNFPAPSLSKADLISLVKAGDGTLLTREPKLSSGSLALTAPFHTPVNHSLAECSQYIIYYKDQRPEMVYNSKQLKSLDSDWLLESISRFELLDPS